MKKLILLAFCLSFLFVNCAGGAIENLKEGDIIFQTSQSSQSSLIAAATNSNKTHCGIIVEKNGQFYVLETLKTIKLTPVKQFIKRGKHQKYWVKSLKQPKDVKIKYSKYLGIPYDLAFKFDNGKYYCSELIYVIYKEQFGIKLCEPRPIKSFDIAGMEKTMKKRGMDAGQYVVAPSDLFDSDLLE